MDTILLLFLGAVTLLVISIFKVINNTAWDVGVIIGGFGVMASGFMCILDTKTITDFPVEYKAFATDSEVIVYTYGDSKYTSDKKKDYDMWSRDFPGFIRKEYNHFGWEVENEFVVKPIEK